MNNNVLEECLKRTLICDPSATSSNLRTLATRPRRSTTAVPATKTNSNQHWIEQPDENKYCNNK